jgi:enoyl-CoA hydratase/carnithine racemase
MIDLKREGEVFVLRMDAGENRFNPEFIRSLGEALDAVEASSGNAALVTTGAGEKFYSNGLDLDWMMGEGAHQANEFLPTVLRLMGRLLGFPVPTVAAMNGHSFAAGAMLALAHDFRVMRVDRGFFCLPEIDLGLPFAPGMAALIQARLSESALRATVLTGARLGGAACATRGIVDEAVPQAEVLPRAIERAAALAGKGRAIYATIKRGMFAHAIAVLQEAKLP